MLRILAALVLGYLSVTLLGGRTHSEPVHLAALPVAPVDCDFCQPVVLGVNQGCGCTFAFNVVLEEGTCSPEPECTGVTQCSMSGRTSWKCPGVPPIQSVPFSVNASCGQETSLIFSCPSGSGLGSLELKCWPCRSE